MLGLGIALLAVGRVFAVKDTIEVGAALLLLWGFSAITLLKDRPSVNVTRVASSTRLHLGESATVQIRIANDGATRSAPLFYEEKLASGARRLSLPAVKPGAKGSASYVLTPSARGVSRMGPGRAFIEDPFRLARRTFRKVPAADLIVYPHKEELRPRRAMAEAVAHGMVRAPAPAAAGAEFFTIREHQQGDDLRKVHWVSSARYRKLMIRQEEQHRHTTVTIVVDDTAAAYRGPGGAEMFERCLSDAASIVDLSLRRSTGVQLVMKATGERTTVGKGSDHRHVLMERLARAETFPSSVPLESLIATSADRPDQLIFITPSPDDPSLLRTLRRVGRLTLVLLEEIDDRERTHLGRAGIETVVAYPRLAPIWDSGAIRSVAQGIRVR